MFDKQKYMNFISGKEFKEVTEPIYYDFFDKFWFFDSSVRDEEAAFTSWDSAMHFEEQLYMKLKEAFYQKNKYRCEFHFYYGMGLYPNTPVSQIENQDLIKDNKLVKVPDYERLSTTADSAIKEAKKAPGTDKKYITEWTDRYSRRSDVYTKAFLMAGYFAAIRSAVMIGDIQNFVMENPD